MTAHGNAREGSALTGVVLYGSGAFAVPSFEALATRQTELGIEIRLVVSQPDRPAGRGRREQPTAVTAWALHQGLPLIRPESVNDHEPIGRVRSTHAPIAVVVAFGQKLSNELLEGVRAVNLHGSLLPAWRGAAPIQRSLMAGDARVGVSVIEVAAAMDAGGVYAAAETEPLPGETAGELHDRLARLGVEPLVRVVALMKSGGAVAQPQDASKATRARKLSRADSWVDFGQSAEAVAARINGLSPWPATEATISGNPVRILRARVSSNRLLASGSVAEVMPDGSVSCGTGAVELLEVQSPGGRPLALAAFLNGRRLSAGVRVESAGKAAGSEGVV